MSPLSAVMRIKKVINKTKERFKQKTADYEKFRPVADRMMDEKYPEGWQNEKTNSLMRLEHANIMKSLYKKSK